MSSWVWGAAVIFIVLVVLVGFFKFAGSRNWSETQGKVTSVSVEGIRKTSAQQVNSSEGLFDYKVDISYSYSVEGQEYTGTVLTAGIPNVFSSKTDADDIVTKFAVGRQVDVYYAPSSPENSALITAKSVPIAGIIGIFIFILAVGGIIFGVIKSGILAD